MVYDQQRHRRLRLLIKKLNKDRKKQAKKIDILCNDFIAAQREFIRKLNTISFAAAFYESILHATDLNSLLNAAVTLITDEFPDANVTFFIRQDENFEVHLFESPQSSAPQQDPLENNFTPALMDAICKANKLCTLDDLLAMGLQCSPLALSGTWAVTIPLPRHGPPLGFMLIRRHAACPIAPAALENLCAVTPGLSAAVQSCLKLLNRTD